MNRMWIVAVLSVALVSGVIMTGCSGRVAVHPVVVDHDHDHDHDHDNHFTNYYVIPL